MCKKLVFVLTMFCCGFVLFAQQTEKAPEESVQKFALVIGNSAYTGLTPLSNPVNDANDISEALTWLGFSVETVLNGSMEQMEDAMVRFKDKLGQAGNAYGFFFYAGHGVQSGGENFLIPVDANIPSEGYLRNRAVSVQALLDDLNDARNSLNVIVLDACRDNPFGWSRGGSRGLAIVAHPPADSIIVYSTSAGQRASDGEGRNGLFTEQLLNNLTTPGLDVGEVFRRTGEDVQTVSQKQQVPAIYNQFFGVAYLGDTPEDVAIGKARPAPMPYPRGVPAPDLAEKEKHLWSIGAAAGSSFGEPWVMGTIKGTISPFKYSFLEIGLNAGLVSTRANVTSYYSIKPYGHVSFFWPFNKTVNAYAGAGIGYSMSQYNYYGFDVSISSMPVDGNIGILLFNWLDVSYTISYPLWTTSSSSSKIGDTLLNNVKGKIGNLFSVGYTYRF